ncbi:MAG: helicase-associated domain-containing protein [Desulfomonilia bacterium]
MMTSTHDLIEHIPGYMIGIISSHILGEICDVRTLAEAMSDTDRLKKILSPLPQMQKTLLMDLYELGGEVRWEVLPRIVPGGLDDLRSLLEELGERGLIFQSGLTGRDSVILLPSLNSLLEDLRQENFRPAGDLVWKEKKAVSIWGHISLLNTIRAFKIRCKAGLEPFKKGWEILHEKLAVLGDIRSIYGELVELGCIGNREGEIRLQPRASTSLAMEGDTRYGIWRLLQSCKPFPGLDYKVFMLLADRAISRDFFFRTLNLHITNADEHGMEPPKTIQTDVGKLVDLWIQLGMLQEDTTGTYLRFSDGVFKALKTGKIDLSLTSYSDEVIIQPTMEILVPRDFDPLDLLNIGEISDLIRADVVSIYKITRESVFRALISGWNMEKIQNFLDRISRHTVPENVVQNIAGWSLTHPEAHIITGTFLVVNDSRNILPQGLEEVLSGIYRIPEKCDDSILNFLEKRGVMVRRYEQIRETEEDIDWGRILPLKESSPPPQRKILYKQGIYPFGMVIPLPFGPKRESIFEEALQEGRPLLVFYPRQGYGEIELKHISPITVYRRGGIPFVEAFCEETGEGEVFDISKIRAIFRHT